MFSLGGRGTGIVKSTLKCRNRDSHRTRWWLADASLVPVTQSIARAIREIGTPAGPGGVEIIKWRKLKIVFRIADPGDASKSYIVKAYLLNRVKHRLKYGKRGLNEVANLITAKRRGINTADVYGYGRMDDVFGLVTVSIIVLEDLRALSAVDDLMPTRPPDECDRVLVSTVPLFSAIYRGACTLFDLNGGSVMLRGDVPDSDVFLVDLERADFHGRPSVEVLMFEAGYFARSCRHWISTEAVDEWFEKLLASVHISGSSEIEEARERFNYYFSRDLPRKERLKIR